VAVDTGAIRDNIVLKFSFADGQVNANRIRGVNTQITANSQLAVTVIRLLAGSAQLQSQGFVLAVGREILLDSAAVWRVPADVNLYRIPADTNIWTISSEVREYKIKETV
jgi:hypothetical protein